MKKNLAITRLTSALLLTLGITITVSGQQQSTISDDAAASRIAWWRDGKFGLFMHWGVYSISGRGEGVQWDEQIPVNEYAKLAGQFHPDKFDPDAWAAIAKSAGMKYTVLTARHHDGFALFDDPAAPSPP
jgi:alpha-L-fucosidase